MPLEELREEARRSSTPISRPLGAADVFLTDSEFSQCWRTSERYYFVVDERGLERIQPMIPDIRANVVAARGGKFVLTNHPL